MTIAGVPAAVYIKDVTYGDRSILYQSLRVGSALGNASLRVILVRDGGTVSTTADSEAIFAAAVKTGKTDQDGVWTSGTLAPGKYFVLATGETIDHSPETTRKLWKARSRGEEVELAPNGKLSVTLSPKSLD